MSKNYTTILYRNKARFYEEDIEIEAIEFFLDYDDNYEEDEINEEYFFLLSNRNLINTISSEIMYEEIVQLFDLFWQHEFRSSNFSTKIFYFFSVWHTSGMTTSFYDFLKKTKLLQDEKYFRALYDKYLRKKYRKAIAREKPRIDALWEQVRRKR
jgi:hypothetical protein